MSLVFERPNNGSEAALDRTFAALAHPIRRSILSRLAQTGTASVTELAEPFDVSLMAISKHLKVLTGAKLVRREKDGRVQRCSFSPESMLEASDWIERHREFWNQQFDQLVDYLEKSDSTAHPTEGDSS
ncbi:MAG: metalloregulator ArsR/SmtB family transcription factor [Acidobacteria bacterium]|nr:metalloregulator ArsR/SmtB family transcription factor [Acidobacteriota bacterium]